MSFRNRKRNPRAAAAVRRAGISVMEPLESRQLLTAVVSADPAKTFFLANQKSGIAPNTTQDLVLNAKPTDTDYHGTFEGQPPAPLADNANISNLTNGTTQSLTTDGQLAAADKSNLSLTGTPDGGTDDGSDYTDVNFDATAPWHATYNLGGANPNPNGYDITEIDSITGHPDNRTDQTIDIQVQFAGSDTNFYSLSGGKNFSYRPGQGDGAAQMAVVNDSGGAMVRGVRAVRFVAADAGAVYRELVVTGSPTAAAPATTVSVAPTGLTATASTAHVTLSFHDASGNAAAYVIERSTDNVTFTTLGAVTPGAANGGTVTYVDNVPAPTTTYYYRVRAVNGAGESANSTVAQVTSTAFGAEAHYFNSSFWQGTPAVNTVVNQINFDYGNGSPDPAIRNTNYSVQFTGKVHTDAAGMYTFISNTDDDGYLFVDGQLVSEDPGGHGQQDAAMVSPIFLNANTDYDFVFLMNQGGGGSGAHMEWVEPDANGNPLPKAIVPADHLSQKSDVPPAPAGLSASPAANSVQLTWSVSNDVNSIGYQVERADASPNGAPIGTFSVVGQAPSQTTTNPNQFGATGFTDTTAMPGHSYVYRVKAVNYDGSSAYTANVAATTSASVQAPGAEGHYFNDEFWKGGGNPTVTGTPDVSTTVGIIDQDIPAGSSPDPSIQSTNYSTQFTGKILTDEAGTYTFITNTDDDGYLWVNGQLVSSDPGGHGPRDATNVVPVKLQAHTAYNFVFEQSQGGGGSAFHLEWIEPGQTAPSIIPAAGGVPSDPANPPTGGLLMVSDVPHHQTVDANGVITDVPSDSAAGDVGVTGVVGGLMVTWTDQSTSEIHFEVQRSTDGTNFSTIAQTGFNATSYTDTTAVAGTKYFYRVRGVNYDGAGPFSAVVNTATVNLPTPTITATRTPAAGQVQLTITGQSPNSAGFELQQSTDGTNFTDVAGASQLPATTTTYTVTGLDPTKTYSFRVRNLAGQGAAGPSAYSPVVTQTAAGPQPVQHSSGFAGQTDLTLNGSAKINAATDTPANALELTSATNGLSASAFTTQVVNVGSFDTTFDFAFPSSSNPANGDGSPQSAADGIAFVIQNVSPTALGGGGGAMGYAGIAKSIAVKFDLHPNTSETGLYLNGADPGTQGAGDTIGIDMSPSGVKFYDANGNLLPDTFRVHLAYDGTTLHETVTDVNTGASFTHDYAVDIAGTVGSAQAYAGFTAATGGLNAQQDVLDWTYTGGSIVKTLPADFNNDGKVNFSDLLILAQHYGKTGMTHATGDANNDGTVNFSDLLVLAQTYGQGTAGATPALSLSMASQLIQQTQTPQKTQPAMTPAVKTATTTQTTTRVAKSRPVVVKKPAPRPQFKKA